MMCAECRQNPCDCRCPNAEPKKEIYRCKECGLGICEGDKYVEIWNKLYHLDCIEDMTKMEILSFLNVTIHIA